MNRKCAIEYSKETDLITQNTVPFKINFLLVVIFRVIKVND